MQTSSAPPAWPAPAAASATGPGLRLLGLVLMLPAAGGLLVSYVWPTLRTGWLALHEGDGPGREGRELVWFENLRRVVGGYTVESADFGAGLRGLGTVLSLAAVPMLLVVVVAPLLAWAVHRSGWPVRWTARLALTAPLVAFVPAALAAGWFARSRADGEVSSAPVAFWVTSSGLVLALAVVTYLAVWRVDPDRPDRPGDRVAAAAVAGLVAWLAVLAVVLQSFTFPFVLSSREGAASPATAAYLAAFQRFDFGLGAAHSVLLLAATALLGLAAGLAIILARVRIELAPGVHHRGEAPRPGPDRVAAAVVTVVALVVTLAVWGYAVWPWLSGSADPSPADLGLLLRTWLPPVPAAVVGVGSAALAGFGIGALRPLGPRSEWLLLPFAPWLFVGATPLMVARFDAAAFGWFERTGTVIGLVPPVALVPPALFLFTVLFRGLAGQRRQRAALGRDPGWRAVLLPATPMVALVAAATWLVQSQSLVWPFLVAFGEVRTLPVWALQQGVSFQEEGSLGAVLPLPLFLGLAAALCVAQLIYLDRLRVRVGRPD